MISKIKPSYPNGFATGKLSKRPNLWGPNLVGLWKPSLGCTGINTLYDISGYVNYGTMNGSMTLDDWVVSGGGNRPAGYALDFDGSNDSVSMGDLSLFDFGASVDFTLMAWVKSDNISAAQDILGKASGAGAEKGYQLRLQSSSVALNLYDGTTAAYFTGNTTLSSDIWYHISVTADRTGNAIIYVNGISDGSLDISAVGDIDVANGLSFGAAPFSFYYFNGLIDDVRIYNRILSDAEIWDTYQFPNAMFEFRDEVIGRVPAAVSVVGRLINGGLVNSGLIGGRLA